MNATSLFECDACGEAYPATEIIVGERMLCESCHDDCLVDLDGEAEAEDECRAAPDRSYQRASEARYGALIDAADFARTFAKEHP